MARVDKTNSAVGVVRAVLAADIVQADWNKVIGVGIDVNGKCVRGAGQTGVIGVVICDRTNYKAGQIADIFKLADIVGNVGLVAGTKYYAVAATGVLTVTAGTDKMVGFTVEADRLILSGL